MLKRETDDRMFGTKTETEIEEDELKAELDSMRKEIYKLSESERLLETERKHFKPYSIFYRKV